MSKRNASLAGLVVTAIVIALLALGAGYWLYGSPYARFGREHGYNPPMYTVVRTIQERASHGPLTTVDIVALRSLAKDASWQVRCRALSTLYATRGTAQMPDAAVIARDRLHDSEWVVRHYALSALVRMGAPDARQCAQAMINDPNEDVRERAKQILRRGR